MVTSRMAVREHWYDTDIHGGRRNSRDEEPLVVVLPGLGLTRYLSRIGRGLAGRHRIPSVVLDLPGYGSPGPRACAPDVVDIGRVAATWILEKEPARPVVLLGHSTGAQAALVAAVRLQSRLSRLAVVLAGPTFAPAQRSLAGVLLRTPAAYSHDPPTELDPRHLLRAGVRDLLALVRSGQRDEPEERVAALTAPLTVTAGRHDAYAPEDWLTTLCERARSAPSVRLIVTGGSHNNPWTHSADVARVVAAAVPGTRAG